MFYGKFIVKINRLRFQGHLIEVPLDENLKLSAGSYRRFLKVN